MDNHVKRMEQFHCSVLLDEVKEKVRKLRAYGVQDADIEAVMYEEKGLPRLVVTKDYRIVIAGRMQREVKMEPLVKAVYLLFLAHPEGILFKRLPDYREELTRYYMATAKLMDKEKVIEGVDHLVNPLDNAINEKCSRIKKVFLSMMDEYSASYYIISSHTQKHFAGSSRIWYERLKVITLPRELVVAL
jgi:hypothetical protein